MKLLQPNKSIPQSIKRGQAISHAIAMTPFDLLAI